MLVYFYTPPKPVLLARTMLDMRIITAQKFTGRYDQLFLTKLFSRFFRRSGYRLVSVKETCAFAVHNIFMTLIVYVVDFLLHSSVIY